jgi:hypothetical protein
MWSMRWMIRPRLLPANSHPGRVLVRRVGGVGRGVHPRREVALVPCEDLLRESTCSSTAGWITTSTALTHCLAESRYYVPDIIHSSTSLLLRHHTTVLGWVKASWIFLFFSTRLTCLHEAKSEGKGRRTASHDLRLYDLRSMRDDKFWCFFVFDKEVRGKASAFKKCLIRYARVQTKRY